MSFSRFRSSLVLPMLALALVACRGAAPRGDAAPVDRPAGSRAAGVETARSSSEGAGAARLRARSAAARDGSAEAHFWRAVAALHVDNDPAAAEAAVKRALQGDANHARALLLDCALAHHQARLAEVLSRCAVVVERAPASPEAEVALVLMGQVRGLHPDHPGRVVTAAFHAVDGCHRAGEPACAELTATAMTLARGIAGQTKDPQLHEAAVTRGGAITSWTVAGPYGPPEVDVFRARAGLGADGVPADVPEPLPTGGVFSRITRVVPDGVLRPARYGTAGLYVAHADIHLARPARFLLDARATGSARVYVDGTPLVTLDRWASSSSPRGVATAVAPPGWHRVSVEIAAMDRDFIDVRLLADTGLVPMDLQQAEAPANTARAPSAIAAPPLPAALPAFTARFRTDADDVEAALAAIWLLQGVPRWNPSEARALAEELARAFPASAVVQQALGSTQEQDHTLPSAARVASARVAYQAALARNPRLTTARYRLAVLSSGSRPDEALDMLRDVVTAQPEHAPAWRSLFEMYRSRGWNAEAAQALEQALGLGAQDRVLEEGASFFRSLGDIPRARELRRRWAASEDLLHSARTAHWRAEELDDAGALAEWQRLLQAHPDHPDQAERLTILERQGDPAALKDALEAHLQRFPSDVEAQQQLCTTLRALNDVRGLRACLDQVRLMAPSSIFPARLEAELAGVELGDLGAAPVNARELIDRFLAVEASGAEFLRGHPTVVVLDAMRRVLSRSGGGFVVQHRLVRVGTREAADQLGELQLDGEEKRTVRVWKADGRIVEPEVGQGKAEISMSGLSPGDFLETRTVTAVQGHTPEGNFLETFFVAGQDPVFLAEYVLEAPVDVADELKLMPRNAPAATITHRDGVMRAVWRAEQVPAIESEPFAAPAPEYAPRIMVALRPDADFDARRECRRFATSAQPTPELIATAAALKARTSSVPALVAAVVEHVRAHVDPAADPLDASEVLAGGHGYQLSAVRALLRLAGVRARLVVARSALGPQVEIIMPRTHDVHVLVIPNGKEDILLSSVGPWLLDGPTPPNLASYDAIEADCDEVARLGRTYRLPPPGTDAWEQRALLELAVATNGDVTGTLTATLTGPMGPLMRQAVGQANAAQLQQWAGSILLEAFPGAQVKGVTTSDVAARSGPFELQVRFTAPATARPAGDVMVWDRFLEKPILRGVVGGLAPEEYLRVGTRQTPLLMSRPLRERDQVRVVLPLGAVVARAPRSYRVDGPGFEVTQNVATSNGTIELTRVTRVDVERVAPADYPDFRARVEQAVQKGRNRLEFRAGQATSRP